jgi:hypothetical protein
MKEFSGLLKKDETVTCPLCGYHFKLEDVKCFTDCTTKCGCNLIGCPNCHYKFPERSAIVGLFRRLLKGKGAKDDQ